jgi:glycosyltransferase involved in cell wall biosynthesis
MKHQLLTIIIPAFNEEKRISKTLESYISFLQKKIPGKFFIIVVLNGCKDNTLDVVKSFKNKHSFVGYKNIKEPIGKGGAIIEGFMLAKSKYISFIDADNSVGPSQFYNMLKSIISTEAGMVIASRNLKESTVVAKNLQRKMLSFGYNKLVNFLFKIDIKDTQCGAKILSTDTYTKIKNKLVINNMAFDINLIYEIKKIKNSILEVPILWEDNSASSIKNPFALAFRMFITTVSYRFSSRKN